MRLRKFTVWLFWWLYYACRPAPRDLFPRLDRAMRTRPPWWKFRPCVWHNDDGDHWHVMLTDERAYTKSRTIKLDCHIGMESGNIVGFNVWDETLEAKHGQ